MNDRRPRKRWKILLIVLGVLSSLVVGFHLWFVHHAESLIEDLVRRQSNGQVELRVRNFKFNWFSKKMELEQAIFFTTDSAAPAAYVFAVRQMKVQVQSVWPLLFEKKILIDSLQLIDPDISVTRRRSSGEQRDSSLSIPQEMGRVYHSIQEALQALAVTRFQITNGSFSLVNPTRPQDVPVRISHLNLQLDNLRIDSTEPGLSQKIFFSDNVSLSTHHQNILFPDGRHRLSFRDFRVNTQTRLAEFDSCTIEATRDDSARNSFRIFFDKLRMTNIDFDTLYHAEVIKADSVYAYDPRIQLNVDIPENSPVAPPRLDELLQQLAGEMELGFVVVENGSFDINTMRAGRPSSFTSDNNNFSLEGLRIRNEGERPVSVKKFAMAIRNYENFIRDSAYAIQFDSIIVNNNRISLSNFEYNELEPGRQFNRIRMRQLELYGLSWDELVFNQKLQAEQITLIRPDIQYRIQSQRGRNNHNLFETLAALSHAMQLERTHIIQGQVSLFLPDRSALTMSDATILLETKELLQATRARDLRDAIQYLDFKKGIYQKDSLQIQLNEAQFIGGENRSLAASLRIRNGQQLAVDAGKVEAPLLVFDEYMRLQAIHGLHWQTARVNARPQSGAGTTSLPALLMTGIAGDSTELLLETDSFQLTGTIHQLGIRELRTNEKSFFIDRPAFRLQPVQLTQKNWTARADSWTQTGDSMRWENMTLTRNGNQSPLQVSAPLLKAGINWNEWIAGQTHIRWLKIDEPTIIGQMDVKNDNSDPKGRNWQIDELLLTQPTIDLSIANTGSLQWKKQKDDRLFITGLSSLSQPQQKLAARRLDFLFHQLNWTGAGGSRFQSGDGLLRGQFSDLQAGKNDLDTWDWKGKLIRLDAENLRFDSLGKRNGQLAIQRAAIQELNLQSGWLLNMHTLVRQNPGIQLNNWTGSYADSVDQFYWYDVSYNQRPGILSVDSFRYSPAVDRDEFHRKLPYQADYVKASTGKLLIGPLDLSRFATDSILQIGRLEIHDGYLNDYRDKRIPREPGIVRALPGNLLKKLPFRFRSDSLLIINSHVDYEEIDDKTGMAGKISVTELNGKITAARNFDHVPGDSLRIEATALLADHIPTRLRVQESYTDSLGGFRMQVEMGPGDLQILNPVLGALARARIKSGQLDSLRMWVQGQENFAYGTMRVYYDNLKVTVLRDKPRSIGTRLLNFFANTLIKNKNRGKDGRVFVNRLRDRSAINYLVKITLSGVISNVGIHKPRKEARKQKKAIRQMLERQARPAKDSH